MSGQKPDIRGRLRRGEAVDGRQAMTIPNGVHAMSQDHYDSLETRDPRARARALRQPAELIAHAMHAPGWARHLAGIDPAVTSRAALAKLPLLRKFDLPQVQPEKPPFGGFNVMAPGKANAS